MYRFYFIYHDACETEIAFECNNLADFLEEFDFWRFGEEDGDDMTYYVMEQEIYGYGVSAPDYEGIARDFFIQHVPSLAHTYGNR